MNQAPEVIKGNDEAEPLKKSDCHWTTILFQDLKAIIEKQNMEKSLDVEEAEQLKILTKKIAEIIDEHSDDSKQDNCVLKYKYITDAAQILGLSKEDFVGREDIICEVISCKS